MFKKATIIGLILSFSLPTNAQSRYSYLELFKGNASIKECTFIDTNRLNNSQIGRVLGQIKMGFSPEQVKGILGNPTIAYREYTPGLGWEDWERKIGENDLFFISASYRKGKLNLLSLRWVKYGNTAEGRVSAECSWGLREID